MESKKLGEHIAKLRRERHMTQTELADRLYITEKAVSKWECGNGFPDLDNIGKLAAFFDISIDELLQAKEKDKLETVSEEQILQLQEGDSPLINCYEDIVVYSSYMDSPLINRLAEKYMNTITQFEEIFYLLDYFTQETLQKLCLYHKEKIAEDTDLSLLLGRISNDSFSALCESKQAR